MDLASRRAIPVWGEPLVQFCRLAFIVAKMKTWSWWANRLAQRFDARPAILSPRATGPWRTGWKVAATFENGGVSGAKGRKDRPGLDAMLKAVSRREVDLVMAWSVDRLGRSLVTPTGFVGNICG